MAGGELECNELESSQNHHAPPHSVEKLSSTKLVSGAKKVGDCRPKRPFYVPSQADLFYKEKKSGDEGFGIQGKC